MKAKRKRLMKKIKKYKDGKYQRQSQSITDLVNLARISTHYYCAVAGNWSTWSNWGSCDCDSLKQNRTSQCGAMFGGSCVGPPVGAAREIKLITEIVQIIQIVQVIILSKDV